MTVITEGRYFSDEIGALYGDWDVVIEDYTVGGYIVHDRNGDIDQTATVWRPDARNGEKFPLISFSHE